MSATVHHRTCNLCEAMCGLDIKVEDGRIRQIAGDAKDVLSAGHICPKGPALRELTEDPDRLRTPMRRVGSQWVAVTWEEAFSEAAERFHDIQVKDGKDAVGVYWGNPVAHNHGALLMSQLFAKVLGSKNKFDSNSQDANPKLFACHHMFRNMAALTVPDIDRTDFFLMIGANPLASGGSIMSLGDVRGRIKAIQERGSRLVVVDPRRTETAEIADEHIAIRPGGDAAFVLAILHVLFAEDRVNRARVAEIATGLADLDRAAKPFSPERVGPAISVDPEVIRRLARTLAETERAVVYGRIGVCHGPFASTASWLIEALNIVTGHFDVPGGMMFPTPAIDLAFVARALGVAGAGRFSSRVRGLPEIGQMLPAATMAEEMETPGAGQIKGLLTLAGNPVLSVPNGDRVARALSRLDWMVSIDFFINETTQHAHLILPARPALMRSHYDLVLHAVAVRNTARYCDPVLPPEPGSKDDWDILQGLTLALCKARGGAQKVAANAFERAGGMSSERAIDLLLRFGPYGAWRPGRRSAAQESASGNKVLEKGLSLSVLRDFPHGVDLGALTPGRQELVRAPDHRADLAPAVFIADLPRIEKWVGEAASQGLVLIGRRHLRSNNSWMHNCPSLVKGPDRTALFLHPEDAAAAGVTGAEWVRVKSQTGEARVRLRVTPDVMPGVASLPHGFGHARAAATLRVAGAVGGPNMNALTDDGVVDPLTGCGVLTGVPIEVSPVS